MQLLVMILFGLLVLVGIAALIVKITGYDARAKHAKPPPPPPPLPKPKGTTQAQFWAGRFKDAQTFFALFNEDPYYQIDEADRQSQYGQGVHFLTPFGESQGQEWYDHDFLEPSFSETPRPDGSFNFATSWAPNWEPWLRDRLAKAGVPDANAVVLFGADKNPNGSWAPAICSPQTAQVGGETLHYLGEHEFSTTYPGTDA